MADPYDKLPAIVFWLMGSLALTTVEKVLFVLPPLLIGCLFIYLMRFRINVLSLGDDEAQCLGINVAITRWTVLLCVTIVTATTVSVCGIVGWVGPGCPAPGTDDIGPRSSAALAGGGNDRWFVSFARG